MKTVIMLPTYNEKENLESLVREIEAYNLPVHILIIDDSSPDGTGEIADSLAREFDNIKVNHRSPKSGRGSASRDGYFYAIDNGYDYYLEMDVDHSHQPKELPSILEAAKNADMVIASRFIKGGGVEGWNWKRRMLHRAADLAVAVILGTPNTDHTNGYRCYKVDKLARINFDTLKSEGYVEHTILEHIYYKAGFKIKEVPSYFPNRVEGESKMGSHEAFDGLKDMIAYRLKFSKHGYKYFLKN